MDAKFADSSGGYYLAEAAHDGLILRPRESLDGATPSSNSIAAMNLLRLGAFTGDGSYRERADRIFAVSSAYLNRAPIAVPRLLCALDFAEGPPCEVVLSGTPGESVFEALRDAVFDSARLNRVVAHAADGKTPAELSDLLGSRVAGKDGAAAYVCQNFSCRTPTSQPAELRAELSRS
jgi:uncharacterized protein YyaL (SSP411 family)